MLFPSCATNHDTSHILSSVVLLRKKWYLVAGHPIAVCWLSIFTWLVRKVRYIKSSTIWVSMIKLCQGLPVCLSTILKLDCMILRLENAISIQELYEITTLLTYFLVCCYSEKILMAGRPAIARPMNLDLTLVWKVPIPSLLLLAYPANKTRTRDAYKALALAIYFDPIDQS